MKIARLALPKVRPYILIYELMHSLRARAMALIFSRIGVNSGFSPWSIFAALFLICGVFNAQAQTFQLESTTVPVAIVKDITPLPERIPIVAGPSGLNLTGLTAQSNAAWVSPTIDTATSTLVLTFSTGSLAVDSSPAATITLSNGTHSAQLTVSAYVSTLNVTRLLDDPVRSRTYALHQNWTRFGALLIFDPMQETCLGSITLGKKPTDLAISPTGNELLAICSVSQRIYAINLQTLRITDQIPLPGYIESDDYSYVTTANVAYGPENILYFTDGASAPFLYVLKRSTGTVLQRLTSGVKYGFSTYEMGVGDIVVSHDNTRLFGWVRSGWSVYGSSTNRSTARFIINTDGTLTADPALAANNNSLSPATTGPALISLDDQTLTLQKQVFDTADMSQPVLTFDDAIYSITPNAEYVSTHNALYEKASGEKLFDLPVSTTVQTFTSDYAKLVYFNNSTKAVKTLDLLQALASSLLVRTTTPYNGEITLPPSTLTWTPLLGIERYRVYLGTSQNAVAQATPGSPQDLGEVTGASITLPTAPVTGTTYYWRVDPVSGSQTAKSNVLSFTASVFNTSKPRVEAATVQGFAAYRATIEIATATPGQTWSAVSSAPWVKLNETSGSTPATLGMALDASQLAAGYHEATITLTAPGGTAVISVGLRVDPLNLTKIKSAPGSRMVYAISEQDPAAGDTARAYLVEIDSLFKTITKTARVGSNATDLAIHPDQNRIYVTNTAANTLLAVGRDSFALKRTYPVSPDTRAVSTAGPGRVFLETYNRVLIMNTDTGAALGYRSTYSEFGTSDPTGRYYYDVDSALVKYDTNTNAFVWQTSQAGRGYQNSNNGPWPMIVSEDGQRVFWSGSVHDKDLRVLWTMEDSIQCVSSDGRYAFSKSMVYDVVLKKALQPMPVTTAVSAHNSVSGNLVVQYRASLGFFRFVGQTTPGAGTSPLAGSLTEPPSELLWPGITGASGYRIYLGTSAASVQEASADSNEYLGETTTGSISIPAPLSIGQTYYWRVDVIMDGKIAKGDVVSFATAPFSTTVTSISTSTVQSHATHTATIDLASTVPGQSWTASSPAAWIGFKRDNGVTPASIKVVMDASKLAVGVHQSTVSVSWSGGSLTIPVSLMVDPLAVTAIRSQADSTRLYAISEVANNGITATRAYLLEIDSLQKCITRTTRVGRNATSLAIHDADNRVYVANRQSSYIHAVDLDTFDLVRTYPLQNTYKLSAGAAGRLIYLSEDSPMAYLLNTTTGEIMSSLSVGEGDGAFEPTGRYYFHGQSEGSPPSIRKLDVSSDTLTQVALVAATGRSVPGYDRPLVMAESGQRMFWNGQIQDQNLAVEWTLPENIYSVSGDGRYAFSETKIYDVAQKKLLKAMPVATTVSAFNTATGRLVVQKGTALEFHTPVGSGLLGDELFPTNLQVVEPPEQLRWKAIPGALAYHVYLGASSEAVAEATPDSDEYLGEVFDPLIDLVPVPPAGQARYWRVDVVMPDDQVAKGELLTFFASTITPDISVIDAVTVQGHVDYPVSVALSSKPAGKTWIASSAESWIHVEPSAGSTPASLDISLEASRLAAGSHQGSIIVTTAEGSFSITVRLKVEAQSIQVMKSAPNSSKVYAISEQLYETAPAAYLLEIDTELSCITRVLPVGTGATGLAVHVADNRIYVANPRMGTLSAIGIDDLLVKRTYTVPRNTSSGTDTVYRVHAGLPGRLIFESEGASKLSIFDTASGSILATLNSSTKGTVDPTGRYFYNGNSSGIRKIDTQGDVFNQALFLPTSGSYSGGGTMSGNGQRLYFEARAYTVDLVAEGSADTWVYATTYDGGLFFSSSYVQAFPSLKIVMSLPGSLYRCAYNDTTQTLVLLVENRIGCYALKAGSSLPTPVLSADNITHGSIRIGWETRALETSSVLEYRRLGASEWTVVPTLPYAYIKTATATDLRPETTYEFRVKAVSPVATSTWSDTLTVTTPAGPPFFEMPADTVVAGGAPLILPITASGSGNVYTVSGLPSGMSFDVTTGLITGSSQSIGHHSVIVSGTNSFGTRSQPFVITIGSTTQNNASARYAGLVSGNTLLTGSWTLDRTGNAFSGSYNCSGGIFKFKGTFPTTGDVREVEITGRLSGVDLEITATWDRVIDRVTLDVYAFGDSVDTFEDTGFVSTWNSRSRPYPKSGLFNAFMLPSSDSTPDEPEGYGFLSLTFANTGAVQIQGETALGNKITWSGPVLDNYNLPLYWKSGDSILWGIISTSPYEVGAPPVFGSLGWVAVFNPTRKAYTNGFGQGLDVVGSRFTAGKAATDLFKTSNTQVLQLGAGGMERMMETLVQPFSISGKKVILPVSNPYQMKLTLTPKTGLVTGSVVVSNPHPSGGAPVKRTITFRGIMVRKTHPEGVDAVGGYFLLPDSAGNVRSGWMTITAPTP